MEKALRPYCELTNAVRIRDLELMNVQERFETFSADMTHNLILRLNSANPVADGESIVAKAIETEQSTRPSTTRMVVWSQRTTGDIYSINEPQISLNSMIAFCLNIHNEAVALRFPPTRTRRKRMRRRGAR
ncbi:hypothetical protein YC2023_101203 [Brassica napus]|uniref:(rape) hypothetical protein n=1 Tax=Brassica napus TaxID=3708 RepID=A0A816UM42_BRANA|nr:unnamed protein product [Brassica napus]